MATSSRRSASLVVILSLLFVPSSPAPATTRSSGSPQAKSLCRTAPFPDLCDKSTSALPPDSGNHAAALVGYVLLQCLSSAKAASGQVQSTALGGAPGKQCATSMADCVHGLTRAVEELRSLGPPGSPGYSLRLGKVQDNTRTASSSAEACAMVLEDVPVGDGVLDAGDTVMRTMQMSSNALVFVNSLDASKH